MSVLQDKGWPTQPQADGDSRPFKIHDLGDMLVKAPTLAEAEAEGQELRRLVHIEKSGPAFYRPEQPPVPVVDMLAQSLQSQSIQSVGDCLNALGRRCFLDVIPTWTRLMTLAGVSVPVHRVSPRRQWAWTEMTEAVTKALRYATQVDSTAGLIQWGEADALLRGYAMDLAVQDEAAAIDDADPRHATFLNNMALYRKFAEGRM